MHTLDHCVVVRRCNGAFNPVLRWAVEMEVEYHQSNPKREDLAAGVAFSSQVLTSLIGPFMMRMVAANGSESKFLN